MTRLIRLALFLALVPAACDTHDSGLEVPPDPRQVDPGSIRTDGEGRVTVSTTVNGKTTTVPIGTSMGCQGGSCDCLGINGECVRSCTGSDCVFTCVGINGCKFSCPRGGCKVYVAGIAAMELDCPGNNCAIACGGIGSCAITGCTNGCSMTCAGIGQCRSSCSAPKCWP